MKNFKSKDLMITIPSMGESAEKPCNLTLPQTVAENCGMQTICGGTVNCGGSCAFLSLQVPNCGGSCAFLSLQVPNCGGSCAFLSLQVPNCGGSCAFLSLEAGVAEISTVHDSNTLKLLKEKLTETLKEVEKQAAEIQKAS